MNGEPTPRPRFSLGRCYITANALRHLAHDDVLLALRRHHAGDWGDVNEHDRQANEVALEEGMRLFSVYHSATGRKFWIITKADRTLTTVMLPEDY